MRLPFLDREEELGRLRRFLSRGGGLAVLYGRRRCGKSRLLLEAIPAGRSAHFVADDRVGPLQRQAMAVELGRLIPGFAEVSYADWDALLARLWREAPAGSVVVIDEFPSLVSVARELPSLLAKRLDVAPDRLHLVVAGSSQRMMQGLVLDGNAPLYGRASEILPIGPLGCGWLPQALGTRSAAAAVDAFAAWGGVPRYWELAAGYASLRAAIRDLVLSPLGVLHEEPTRLLLDDVRDVTQAASILALVGRGCHRLSEIAGGLGKPATSLSRPMERLLELGVVRRDQPFGASVRDSKRSLYRISDPFLRFWFRFVETNRSRLEARQERAVLREMVSEWPAHAGSVWEDLVRASVPRRSYLGTRWGEASSWWGPGADRSPMEVDVVAESADGATVLVGEVDWSARPDARGLLAEARRKAANLPLVRGRPVVVGAWTRAGRGRGGHFGPPDVLRALR
jgi:hypothetical protein